MRCARILVLVVVYLSREKLRTGENLRLPIKIKIIQFFDILFLRDLRVFYSKYILIGPASFNFDLLSKLFTD